MQLAWLDGGAMFDPADYDPTWFGFEVAAGGTCVQEYAVEKTSHFPQKTNSSHHR